MYFATSGFEYCNCCCDACLCCGLGFRPVSEQFTMFDDQTDGVDPPYGASINYWLAGDVTGDAEIEISNVDGDIVDAEYDDVQFNSRN